MLGIVLINYKNHQEVLSYIKNELVKISTPYTVVVVDNSCDKQEYVELSEGLSTLDKVYTINANANLGYAKANNLGARFLLEKHQVEYLLFSNTDIRIIDENVVEVLIANLEENRDIAAIGPKVISLKGKSQNPYNYISFVKKYVLYFFFYPFLKVFNKTSINLPVVSDAREGCYYTLSGCFLMLRSSSFVAINMFDENTFLYSEEQILAERLKDIDQRMYYLPDVQIVHFDGASVNKYFQNKAKLFLLFKSEKYYYSNYIGTSKFIILLGALSIRFFLFFAKISNVFKKIRE